MSADGLLAILPFLVLAAGAVAAMLSIAVQRDHRIVATIAAATLFLALAALAVAARHAPRQVTPLLVVDGYALYYLGIVLASALAVTVLSYGYFAARYAEPREEYYVLLLLATLGAAVMTAGSHFAAFFLGLETLSIALIGLIAYPRSRARPLEAGIKYLMLSGVSSAFLLFGIALVYAVLGTLPFAGGRPPAPAGGGGIYWIAGLAMILVGIGFKLSVVPFHLWAPDVYEGAPAPVTAFVAVVSKCAVFALLLRYFIAAGAFAAGPLAVVLSVIAVLSMIAGNLLALLQDNVKRILAYSSIAHLGYALVAFLASGALAIEAVSMYLAAYAITTVGAFGVVTLLSAAGDGRDADLIDEYRGLFWRRPWLAVTFAAMLLSLAGIPLTVGFVAKFYAVTAGVAAHLDIPVAALVIGSVIGLFYYLRIIVAMIAPQPATATAPGMVPLAGTAVMAVLAALLIAYGVYPAPLVALVRTTAVSLAFHHRPVPRAALDALPGKAPASVLRATERAAAGPPPTSGALR